jgi:hypothetical protein
MKHPTATFLRCTPRLDRNENVIERKISKPAKRARLFTAGLAMAVVVLSSGNLCAGTRAETLQAINWVENPSETSRPGAFGELGAYQFRQSTWEMHTQRPFAEATDRRASDEVAVLHYEWLKAALERAGIEPTTYNIALAWNAGVNAVIRNHAPAVARNYATRVNNLAADMGTHLAADPGSRQLVAAK